MQGKSDRASQDIRPISNLQLPPLDSENFLLSIASIGANIDTRIVKQEGAKQELMALPFMRENQHQYVLPAESMLIYQLLSCPVAILKHSQKLCFLVWEPQYATQRRQTWYIAGSCAALCYPSDSGKLVKPAGGLLVCCFLGVES